MDCIFLFKGTLMAPLYAIAATIFFFATKILTYYDVSLLHFSNNKNSFDWKT